MEPSKVKESLDAIVSQLLCIHCEGILSDCRRTTCGHWICCDCADSLFAEKARSVPCPACNHKLAKVRSFKEDTGIQLLVHHVTTLLKYCNHCLGDTLIPTYNHHNYIHPNNIKIPSFPSSSSDPSLSHQLPSASVQQSASAKIQESTSAKIQKSTSATVQKSASTAAQKSVPAAMQKSASAAIQKSAPASVQRSASAAVQKSVSAHRLPSAHKSAAVPKSKTAQISAPALKSTPAPKGKSASKSVLAQRSTSVQNPIPVQKSVSAAKSTLTQNSIPVQKSVSAAKSTSAQNPIPVQKSVSAARSTLTQKSVPILGSASAKISSKILTPAQLVASAVVQRPASTPNGPSSSRQGGEVGKEGSEVGKEEDEVGKEEDEVGEEEGESREEDPDATIPLPPSDDDLELAYESVPIVNEKMREDKGNKRVVLNSSSKMNGKIKEEKRNKRVGLKLSSESVDVNVESVSKPGLKSIVDVSKSLSMISSPNRKGNSFLTNTSTPEIGAKARPSLYESPVELTERVRSADGESEYQKSFDFGATPILDAYEEGASGEEVIANGKESKNKLPSVGLGRVRTPRPSSPITHYPVVGQIRRSSEGAPTMKFFCHMALCPKCDTDINNFSVLAHDSGTSSPPFPIPI